MNFLTLCIVLGAAVGADADRVIEIRARRFAYEPNIVRVQKGETVQIRLISEDVRHGLYLDGYELQTTASPGQEGTLKFVADKTGRYSFRCAVTCGEFHPYMIGYLVVEPNWRYYGGIGLVGLMGLGSLLVTLRGPGPPQDKLFGLIPLGWRFELTRFRPIRALFKSRWFPLIPIVVNLFIFTIIILAAIVGGFGPGNYNFGIMIVWILWWVLLMMFMVPLIGRLWCMVCPFPLIGDWIQRGKLVDVGRQKSWGLNKRLPNWMRNLWPLVLLLWVATWFSGFFTVRPLATFFSSWSRDSLGGHRGDDLRQTGLLPVVLPGERVPGAVRELLGMRGAGQRPRDLQEAYAQDLRGGERPGLRLPVDGTALRHEPQHLLRTVSGVLQDVPAR